MQIDTTTQNADQSENGAEDDGNSAFADAFNEFAKEADGNEAGDAQMSSASNDADVDAAKSADAASAQDDPPAEDPEQGKNSGDNDEESANVSSAAGLSDEFLATLPEGAKQEIQRLRAEAQETKRFKNQAAGLNRRLHKTEQELSELRQAGAKAADNAPPNDPADKSDKSQNQGGDDEDPDMKELRELYPEIAGPLEKHLKKQGESIAEMNKRLTAHDDRYTKTEVDAERNALTETLPGWDQLVDTPVKVRLFGNWLREQPPGVRKMAEANSQDITNADDAAFVLGQYSDHLKRTAARNAAESIKGDASQNSQANDGQARDQPNSGGTQNGKRRTKQLESAAAGARSQSPGGSQQPAKDDFGSAFDYYASQA